MVNNQNTTSDSTGLFRARLLLVIASILWSASGFFTRWLQTTFENGTGPEIHPLQMAFFRVLFAAFGIGLFVRSNEIKFAKPMLFTSISFAVMNALFVSALAMGSAANAILLQYTSLVWCVLFSVFWLQEKPDLRAIQAVFPALIGIIIIVVGGWHAGEGVVILIALGSGLTYAFVLTGIRAMHDISPAWITFCNLIMAAIVLLPFVITMPFPTIYQLLILLMFGVFQLGLPYLMTAKSLKVISAQEAGILTLLEPVLSPIWAYLIAPEKDAPILTTWVGGGLLLAALFWRYYPVKNRG
jgi:drug/metabolite transporter, DME family